MAARKPSKKAKAEDEEIESPFLPPVILDPRALEKTMYDLTRIINQHDFDSEEELHNFLQTLMVPGQPVASPIAQTPLEEAQEIIYEAWNTRSKTQRIKLAKKALSISEDCADAYVLLAEESARTVEQALHFYEQGMAAGERALGLEAFEEYKGNFWAAIETRPYMRAREGLALALWRLGDRDAAIDHFVAMLDLNPGDNQGVRYHLLELFQETEEDDSLRKLLKRYKDDASAQWFYTQALVTYRQYKGGIRANKKLSAALAYNPFVPQYLLGRKRLPKQHPSTISFGNEDEAVDYVADALPFWYDTPGALDWLRDMVERSKTRQTGQTGLD
ncbi:MAG: hypothetical protein K1X50_12040 [Candidatus Promineofilum sp.]|nr:hypothetical protein [Promineifilum sp.]MCW5865134.1 hypothetical protein [Anaerolineae bacterium]